MHKNEDKAYMAGNRPESCPFGFSRLVFCYFLFLLNIGIINKICKLALVIYGCICRVP